MKNFTHDEEDTIELEIDRRFDEYLAKGMKREDAWAKAFDFDFKEYLM